MTTNAQVELVEMARRFERVALGVALTYPRGADFISGVVFAYRETARLCRREATNLEFREDLERANDRERALIRRGL